MAGLVFVDAIHADLDVRIENLLSAEQAADRQSRAGEPGRDPVDDILTSEAHVKRAKPLPDVPLLVIRHGLPLDGSPDWTTDAVEKLWPTFRTTWPR